MHERRAVEGRAVGQRVLIRMNRCRVTPVVINKHGTKGAQKGEYQGGQSYRKGTRKSYSSTRAKEAVPSLFCFGWPLKARAGAMASAAHGSL